MFLIEIVDPFIKLMKLDILNDINFLSVIVRIILAVVCGGLLGIERTRKQQEAGFRTYILVCLGSSIAMLTNEYITLLTNSGDMARIGSQVISGIGFLGAGTIIITSRNKVRGLTTAASLWTCACLGLAIGVGFYTLAILSTIIIVIILAVLPACEKILLKNSDFFTIHIEFDSRANLKDFVNLVRNMDLKILSISRDEAYASSGLSVYSIQIKKNKNSDYNHSYYIDLFKDLSYVNFVEEIH